MNYPLMRHVFAGCLCLATSLSQAADLLKPFILGSQGPGAVAAKVAEAKTALGAQGFEIAGEYSPYAGAHLLVVSSLEQRKAAAKSTFGGYGAVQRVAVTQVGDKIEVSYTNPLWMAAIYRMDDDLKTVAGKLKAALGETMAFGSDKGISAAELRQYHYMVMMPYFDDHNKLAQHASYEAAVQAVHAGLTGGKGGVREVYRVDVAGKKEALFGVGLSQGDGADAKIMKIIDTNSPRHTAHLPYEVLVTADGSIYALHGKFRIAQSFPDLSMGNFMEISAAPDAIELSITAAVK